ncbi:hypothetical protein Tco_1204080 [Tanacetum coccineum]
MGNVKKSVAKRTRHQRQYDRKVNKRQMQTQKSKVDSGKALNVGLVVTESSMIESEVQDKSIRPGDDTDADDVDIKPIYDEELMAEVQLTAECNIFAKRQQHTEQPGFNNEGGVEQYTEKYSGKVFAIVALKNELRKLKGNSVDTKFAKPSILGKLVLQPLSNQSVVKQPNAFKSKRPKISKPRLASQVDVKKDLNSSKNMPRFSSNDMVHNHYLEEAKEKTQERDKNSTSSVMYSARWVPTDKIFASCTSKADNESTHGSNVDILKIHKCKQTLDLSIVVSKSFGVTTADASNKRQQQPNSTSSTSTLATTVTADGNFDLYKHRCCNLVPAKSDSLPHAHAQAFKVKHSTS